LIAQASASAGHRHKLREGIPHNCGRHEEGQSMLFVSIKKACFWGSRQDHLVSMPQSSEALIAEILGDM
jgi:hypothetical protein